MTKEQMIVDVITKSGSRLIDTTTPSIKSLVKSGMKKSKEYLEKVYNTYVDDRNNFAFYVALMCM